MSSTALRALAQPEFDLPLEALAPAQPSLADILERPVRRPLASLEPLKNQILNMDCLVGMEFIPDQSIDMILCDLPYGTTQNKWDAVIPFDRLWAQYKRIIKPNGAIVLFAAQPFSSMLVVSNLPWFKYDWTWKKTKGTGHLNAKKQPLRDKEDILVFYGSQCTYNPQFSEGKPFSATKRAGAKQQTDSYGDYKAVRSDNPGIRYPRQVLDFSIVGRGSLHPTQKPTDLLEYLVKTYTNEGEVVLDNCMGVGSTAVACINTERDFIGFELDAGYHALALDRSRTARKKGAPSALALRDKPLKGKPVTAGGGAGTLAGDGGNYASGMSRVLDHSDV